jgi:hypothetical protein
MSATTYLIFGDLHGRVLPAFRLAQAWGREHGVAVAGLLQVGDLGFFPETGRLDKATLRHARDDPMELGVQLVTEPSKEADAVFYGDEGVPEALWFTAGNHEDFTALNQLERTADRDRASFGVDCYGRVRCLRDGHVETLAGGLKVGALWGIDDQAPRARRNVPPAGRIRPSSALALACSVLDVLLTHESPRDAVLPGAGSEEIGDLIRSARPAFAFFGHYGAKPGLIEGDFGPTRVFLLAGLELRRAGGCAEEGSVGALTWDGRSGTFAYLDPAWLRTFTRHNWRHR